MSLCYRIQVWNFFCSFQIPSTLLLFAVHKVRFHNFRHVFNEKTCCYLFKHNSRNARTSDRQIQRQRKDTRRRFSLVFKFRSHKEMVGMKYSLITLFASKYLYLLPKNFSDLPFYTFKSNSILSSSSSFLLLLGFFTNRMSILFFSIKAKFSLCEKEILLRISSKCCYASEDLFLNSKSLTHLNVARQHLFDMLFHISPSVDFQSTADINIYNSIPLLDPERNKNNIS